MLRIRRNDYLPLDGRRLSKRLVGRAKAKREGRPFVFDGRVKGKNEWAMPQPQRSPVTERRIAVLATMETCSTFTLKKGLGRPLFYRTQIPKQVLCCYFLDVRFGLMHARVQMWAPVTIEVYVNGHGYVARWLTQLGLRFEQRDNAFVQLDDPQRSIPLASKISRPVRRALEVSSSADEVVSPVGSQGDRVLVQCGGGQDRGGGIKADADCRVGQKLRGCRAVVRGRGGTGQLTTGPLKKVMFGSIGGIICR